jgi:hypothetical protein
VLAGAGTQRIYGKGTVVVVDADTQTPGIAEELWEARNQYPCGGAPTYRRPTPGINSTGKAIYERFQDLLQSIKLAKDRIAELGPIVDWQKRTYPERYDRTLEERLEEWRAQLRKHEDSWWELNFPDPARRAQERISWGFQRSEGGERRTASSHRPKPPPPPGPPPPLNFADPPEIREAESQARREIAEQRRFIRSFPLTFNSNGEDLTEQGQPETLTGLNRTSVLNRIELPVKPPSKPLEPHPQVKDLSEAREQTQALREKGKRGEVETAKGHTLPHPLSKVRFG